MARKHKMTGNHSAVSRANRFYWTWNGMTRRCHDRKFHKFRTYGARGITVCAEWRESAAAFYAWAEETHVEGCTLDRRDNERGYSPENCRWATPVEQAGNSRIDMGKSLFRGVQWDGSRKRWRAILYANGKRYACGRHKTEIGAARARDAKIAKLGLPLTRQSGA